MSFATTRNAVVKALTVAVALAVALLALAACGGAGQAASSSASAASSEAASSASGASSGQTQTQAAYATALSGNGLTTAFLSENIFDGSVKGEEDAAKAVEGAAERIGGDEMTELELVAIRPTEDDTTYYVFRQIAGDVYVNGASVKLVVDKAGKATGLISAILPDVQIESMESWAISQQQAEEAVLKECAAQGVTDAKVVSGATEQTVIPIEQGSKNSMFAWVVYTNNYGADTDMAYLAHYVDVEGDYLYALGMSEPSNADALAGDAAAFAFGGYEQTSWTGTVKTHTGATRELTVPTLADTATGAVILGDGKRKVLCADFAEFKYNETIAPREQGFAEAVDADREIVGEDAFEVVIRHTRLLPPRMSGRTVLRLML